MQNEEVTEILSQEIPILFLRGYRDIYLKKSWVRMT